MSGEELAMLYKADEITIDEALEAHLRNLGISAEDELLFVLQMALGFANLGHEDRPVPLSGDRTPTVAEVIDQYSLRPFVEDRSPWI